VQAIDWKSITAVHAALDCRSEISEACRARMGKPGTAKHAKGTSLSLRLDSSGDSDLKKRRSDEAEVFQIKNPRWADHWQQQAYAVMLVIRTSEGKIRWMDVSAN
jgi:hypothetical protein